MTTSEVVQLACVFVMCLVVIGIGWNRWHTGKSLGVRSIQYLGIGLVVPGAIVLTMADKVGGEAAIAVLAALVGYLFGSFAKFDDRHSQE
jgi:hypothetical protein